MARVEVNGMYTARSSENYTDHWFDHDIIGYNIVVNNTYVNFDYRYSSSTTNIDLYNLVDPGTNSCCFVESLVPSCNSIFLYDTGYSYPSIPFNTSPDFHTSKQLSISKINNSGLHNILGATKDSTDGYTTSSDTIYTDKTYSFNNSNINYMSYGSFGITTVYKDALSLLIYNRFVYNNMDSSTIVWDSSNALNSVVCEFNKIDVSSYFSGYNREAVNLTNASASTDIFYYDDYDDIERYDITAGTTTNSLTVPTTLFNNYTNYQLTAKTGFSNYNNSSTNINYTTIEWLYFNEYIKFVKKAHITPILYNSYNSSLNTNTLVWSYVSNVKNGYTIYKDGVAYSNNTNNIHNTIIQYKIPDSIYGSHTWSFKANNNTSLVYENNTSISNILNNGTPVACYVNLIAYSENTSNSITVERYLSTPTLSISKLSSGKINLHWDSISGASEYYIRDNGVIVNPNPSATETDSDFYASIGSHSYTIQAIYNPDTTYNSAISNTIELRVNLLDSSIINWENYLPENNLEIADHDAIASGADIYYTSYDPTIPILTYANVASFPSTGSTSSYYFADDTKLLYRWSGSAYVLFGAGTKYGTTISFNSGIASTAFYIDNIGSYIVQVQPQSTALILDGGLWYICYSTDPTTNTEVKSNLLYYNNIKVEAPVLAWSGDNVNSGILTWNIPDYTETIEIYANNVLYATVDNTTTSYTITEAFDNVIFKVVDVAIQDTISGVNYSEYVDSEYSNELQYGILDTPTLTSSSNVLTWSAVDNASYYEVATLADGTYTTLYSTINTSYTVAPLIPINYNLHVRAISTIPNISNSEYTSTPVSMTFYRLVAPSIVLNSSNELLIYTNDSNADSYDIYVNGVYITNTSSTTIDITGYMVAGTNTIYVRANSTNPFYLISKASSILYSAKTSSSKYVANIEGYSDSFELNVPGSIKITADESRDMATFSIVPNDIATPIEPYSDVDILIFDDSNETVLATWHFYLSKDEVEEITVGEESKYKHNLTLIELTKRLETEFPPNIAITQDSAYIENRYNGSSGITPDTGDYIDLLNSSEFNIGGLNPEYIGDLRLYRRIFKSSVGTLSGKLNANYKIGDAIAMPMLVGSTVSTLRYYPAGTEIEWLAWLLGDKYDQKTDISLVKNYYYRTHSENYAVDSEHPEIVIKEGVLDSTDTITHTFYDAGSYDIIMTIDPIAVTDTAGTEYSLNLMGTKVIDYSTAWNISNFVPYRKVWSNITIASTIPLEEEIYSSSTRVSDILTKLVNTIYPLTYNTSLDTPKYSIDPIILNLTKDLVCPELTFDKGKSLYEDLKILGREFGGLPRLGTTTGLDKFDRSMITFDILNETMVGNPSFDAYADTPIETDSDIDNHSTGFVSTVYNMISEDNSDIYPYEDGWITATSTSASDTYVLRNTAGLTLPKSINRVIKLEVKWPNGMISDLTSYLKTKTEFNNLSDSAEGKGLALYYDGNKIYNIGTIPEVNETEAIWGLSATEYVIQKIAYDASNVVLSSTDVLDIKYRITYVPISNPVVRTEQNKIVDLKEYNYKAFNQDSNNITDKNFGKGAQQQLARLGNNTIRKTYQYNSIVEAPILGDSYTYNSDIYYADEILYTFNENNITVGVSFSKDINKINNRIGVDSAYRQYEIYSSGWIDRNINIDRYAYITNSPIDYLEASDYAESTYLNYSYSKILRNMLNGTPYTRPNNFYITSKKLSDDDIHIEDITWTNYSGETVEGSGYLLPASYYTLNTSILFTAKAYDNFSMGVNAKDADTLSLSSSNRANKYIQQDIRYVDDYGKALIQSISLGNVYNYSTLELYKSTDKNYDLARTLPEVDYIAEPRSFLSSDSTLVNNNYYIDKDNREALTYNFQMHYISLDKNITVYSGIAKYMWEDPDNSIGKNLKLVLYKTKNISGNDYMKVNATRDILDAVPTATYSGNVVSLSPNNGNETYTIAARGNGEVYDGYAYVWDDVNSTILFSVEEEINLSSNCVVGTSYLTFTDHKISL